MSKPYLNLFVTEKFTVAGEEKTKYTKVGACFPHANGTGFGIEIAAGISISGNVVALPPRDNTDDNSA